jgi:hypothetical protein
LEIVYVPGADIGYLHLPESREQIEVKQFLIEGLAWGTEEFREGDWRREREKISL